MADLDRREFLRALGLGSAAAAAAPLIKHAHGAADAERIEIAALKGEPFPRAAEPAPAAQAGPAARPPPPVERFPARRAYAPGVDPILRGKAYIVATGASATVENVEGYGAASADFNAALVRVEADECDLINVYAHDNQQGVLSSPKKKRVTVRRSRFARNGSNGNPSGLAHNLYLSADTVEFVDSVSLYAKQQGHLLKSRGTVKTTIQRAILAGLDGWNSRCVDFTYGADAFVDQVILQIGPGNDGGWNLMYFNSEGKTVDGKLRIGRVIAVNDWGKPNTALLYFKGAELVIDELVLIGPWDPKLIYNKGTGTIGKVTIKNRFATRAEARKAGLNCPDYDGTEWCVRALWPAAWGPQPGLWDEEKVVPRGAPVGEWSAPASVPQGGSAPIAWEVRNADYVEGLGVIKGPLPLKGRMTIGPLSGPVHAGLRAVSYDKAVDVVKDIAIGASAAIDLAKLPKGWTEIPGTVFPGHHDAINAWGTAALVGDSLIIVAQGGHRTATPGDVWRFRLSTMRWQKDRDHDPIVGRTSTVQGKDFVVTGDGPPPKHGYNGVVGIGGKVVVGGAFPPFAFDFLGVTAAKQLPVLDGTKSGSPWLYDPATKTYDSLSGLVTGAQMAIVADTQRNLLFVVDGPKSTLTTIDMTARKIAGTQRLPHVIPGAIAYGEGRLVWFGSDSYHSDRSDQRPYLLLAMVDVTDPTKTKGAYWNLTPDVPPGSLGGTYRPVDASLVPAREDWITSAYGLQYHPPSKRFAAWRGGADVLWFDPAALKITRESFAAGPNMPSGRDDGGNGVFGRWQYLAAHGAFLGLCSPKQNVWLLKP